MSKPTNASAHNNKPSHNNTPARHTGFKVVSTGRQGDTGEQDKTTIARHFQRPSPSFPRRRESTGQGTTTRQNNHSPSLLRPLTVIPVSLTVILALRQYPQGRATTRQHNRQNPLSLDGRGIKGEGDPALDTGLEGEQVQPPPVTWATNYGRPCD